MGRVVFGADALARKLAAIPRATRVEVRRVLDVSADEMVSLAKQLVAVDDGDLRDSIRKEPGAHELAVVVTAGGEATTSEVRSGSGEEYDHALANEYGTSNMPEQPFFWTSYRAIKKRAKGRASRAVRKAAKAAVAGVGK